jgi:hypothetical protein
MLAQPSQSTVREYERGDNRRRIEDDTTNHED